MFRNGLHEQARLGMTPGQLANALARVDRPNVVGAGMVLGARGNVYGDEGRVPAATVAKRRAANRRARAARRIHRKAAR